MDFKAFFWYNSAEIIQEDKQMDFTRLTEYLDSLHERYQVHGLDCVVMKDHEVLYRHMSGVSDYEGTKPVSDTDLYDLYSCTKVLTMTAVMQLIEQGKLGLDDELAKYIPEYSDMRVCDDYPLGQPGLALPTLDTPSHPAENKILIRHLMAMGAGMSYDVNSEPIRKKIEETGGTAGTLELVKEMAKMPLMYEPGTRFAYSLAHDVLAAVIEVVSGMTFGEYLRRNIFDPLGIEEAYLQVPEEVKHRLSAKYEYNDQTKTMAPDSSMTYRLTPNYESGGAGLTTTVSEYIKLLDALANGGVGATGNRILKEESIITMSRVVTKDLAQADFDRFNRPGYGYSLGFRTLIDASKSKSPLGEFGWDGAAGAYALVDPTNHIAICYAHEIRCMWLVYTEIHPVIRDLAYEIIGNIDQNLDFYKES